jgi:hypothetical protein
MRSYSHGSLMDLKQLLIINLLKWQMSQPVGGLLQIQSFETSYHLHPVCEWKLGLKTKHFVYTFWRVQTRFGARLDSKFLCSKFMHQKLQHLCTSWPTSSANSIHQKLQHRCTSWPTSSANCRLPAHNLTYFAITLIKLNWLIRHRWNLVTVIFNH